MSRAKVLPGRHSAGSPATNPGGYKSAAGAFSPERAALHRYPPSRWRERPSPWVGGMMIAGVFAALAGLVIGMLEWLL